jgi:alginate O-acetyltransferase complex protein AlgI
VFTDPGRFDTAAVWMAVVAYAIQVYCDFSGYSDIALGTARLLGYRLAVNFNLPFASPNMSEFWRRWHMSLSSWIRDYVYIPLGGSRGTIVRTSLNLLFAMTLFGLWHGASWTFVVFGALNGVYLIVHRLFRSATRDMTGVHVLLQTLPGTAFRIALTFAVFTLSLVLFRSPTFATAANMFERMLVSAPGAGPPVPAVTFWTFAGVVLIAHLVAAWPENWARCGRASPALRGLALAGMLFLTLVLTPVKTWTFIYFQF